MAKFNIAVIGGEAEMDAGAQNLAAQAAQAGQKNIFDHASIGGLAKVYDTGAVIELSETDKHLDADYRAQLRSLITFMMEDPRSISATIDIMFMNKSIERIGDHAENIAEHVVYLTRGIDVRHRPLEQIKADLSE